MARVISSHVSVSEKTTYLLTYAHRSQWSIGHQRPPAIALCSGLLLSFRTSWSISLATWTVFPVSYIVLMLHVASRVNALGVRRGVSLAASFRLSLHCVVVSEQSNIVVRKLLSQKKKKKRGGAGGGGGGGAKRIPEHWQRAR